MWNSREGRNRKTDRERGGYTVCDMSKLTKQTREKEILHSRCSRPGPKTGVDIGVWGRVTDREPPGVHASHLLTNCPEVQV